MNDERPKTPNPGATGRYPDGSLGPTDEGELRALVVVDPEAGRVHMDFGKAVRWVSMTPQQARQIAELLRQKSYQAEQRRRR